MLGKSDSAELLCTYQGRRVLVEGKSSGGRAGEGIYAKLVTHLELWPRLVPKKPVDGGVLVVNHECRKEPGARSVKAFTRAAFVQGALHPIVTSMELFEAWRAGDKRRVRALVMGAPSEGEAPVEVLVATSVHTTERPMSQHQNTTRSRGTATIDIVVVL